MQPLILPSPDVSVPVGTMISHGTMENGVQCPLPSVHMQLVWGMTFTAHNPGCTNFRTQGCRAKSGKQYDGWQETVTDAAVSSQRKPKPAA